MALPVKIGVVRGLLKELRVSAEDTRPIAIGGASELARALERALVRGGDARAVRVGGPEGAAIYVHVVAGADKDVGALERARRARVPIVAVAAAATAEQRIPHVLATDVVPVPAGARFPVDAVAAAIARKLGEEGTSLAARLPVLRAPVCRQLVRSFALKNGIVGAAVFIPGADLPLLTLNQLRLVLRIAGAYGEQVDQERVPEILGVLGASLGLRAVARELLDAVPVAGWALKGAVAYTGTRALGEAAVAYFEARTTQPQPAAASRA